MKIAGLGHSLLRGIQQWIRALGSATAADAPEQAVEPNVFLVDPLSQGIFTGLDLVGAFNFIPRWLPDLRSVRESGQRRQHDDSGEGRAHGGATLGAADIWTCAAVSHGRDSWLARRRETPRRLDEMSTIHPNKSWGLLQSLLR
jgi:hypothetical protein